VDRAALDAAMELGIAHGGHIPKGRMTDDGPLPDRYGLKEMSIPDVKETAEKNVIDSDGTLIITYGHPPRDMKATEEMAKRHGRPCLFMDLEVVKGFTAAEEIKFWMVLNGIHTLHVTGSSLQDPENYDDTIRMVKAVYYLFLIEDKRRGRSKPLYPRTVDEAVDRLMAEVALKDRVFIARMERDELYRLDRTLGMYLREHYGLNLKRGELMKDCRYLARDRDLKSDQASTLIITEFWKKVRATHLPRVVK